MIISVVIPTYSRGEKITHTINALIKCHVDGIDIVDIIVVDDGSPEPAAQYLVGCSPTAPFTLKCLRQDNAGPAAARNAGFRLARGEIVLFLDDDIHPLPQTLLQHVTAHRENPHRVIFGSCLLIRPTPLTPLAEYVDGLHDPYPKHANSTAFHVSETVASGQLSVERRDFAEEGGVYACNLITPAAEEYELSHRLKHNNISIIHAPHIICWHDHPVLIQGICRQQYKHASGIAEVFRKYPKTIELDIVRNVIENNRPSRQEDRLSKRLKSAYKRILCSKYSLLILLKMSLWLESLLPWRPLLIILYSLSIKAHFVAGLRDGLIKYNKLP